MPKMVKQSQITRVASRFLEASITYYYVSLDDVAQEWEDDVLLAIRDVTGSAWKRLGPGTLVSDLRKVHISMAGLDVDLKIVSKNGGTKNSSLKDPAPEEIGRAVADALGVKPRNSVRTPSLGRRRNSWIWSVLDMVEKDFSEYVEIIRARSGMDAVVRLRHNNVDVFSSDKHGCWFGDTGRREPFDQTISAKDFADRVGLAVVSVLHKTQYPDL